MARPTRRRSRFRKIFGKRAGDFFHDLIDRVFASGRSARKEWQIDAVRGMRRSGTIVVILGMVAILVLKVDLPSPLDAWFLPFLSVGFFMIQGVQHLIAVWSLEKIAARPTCISCRIVLDVASYECPGCQRVYSAKPPAETTQNRTS
ncbi:MAG TPA: hypothetical protein VM889_04210 [Candidatus Thermoplasmatota archaeon]|nr:hypothetical protein [Candidatus Thermoplasmatota archaeon]